MLGRIGYRAGTPQYISDFYPCNGISDQLILLYQTTVQEQICSLGKNEVSGIQWVSKSKRRAMIANSEIRCGVLLIGMLRFLL